MSREHLSNASQAHAELISQVAQSGTGEWVTVSRQVEGWNTKPFVGELNGFTFYDPAKIDQPAFAKTWSPACELAERSSNIRQLADETALSTHLRFSIGYLPQGASQKEVTVSSCAGDIFAVSKDYVISSGATIQVNRKSRPPMVLAVAPKERLRAETIGGRPAVIVPPEVAKGRTTIHMRDPLGVIDVHCFQIELGECIKVAAGVA